MPNALLPGDEPPRCSREARTLDAQTAKILCSAVAKTALLMSRYARRPLRARARAGVDDE